MKASGLIAAVVVAALANGGTQAVADTVTISNLGNLPPGKTVVIRFDATVHTVIPPGTTQIATQGSIGWNSTLTALTDDPDTATPGDSTITHLVFTPTSTATPTPTATATRPPTPTPTPVPQTIQLERTHLNFGVVKTGSTIQFVTPPQTVGLTVPSVSWMATSDQPFVTILPGAGGHSARLAIQIASSLGLPDSGRAPTATVTITAPGVPNSPQAITVDVTVYALGATTNPFGFFDTPQNNSVGIHGALPVTGWSLDDIGVSSLQLYRDPVAGDPPTAPNGKIFIGDATFVAGQRSDVDALFPTYPQSYRGAWGYMLLTNLLPDRNLLTPAGGNGAFTLYAYANDVEGHQTLLGSRTFTADNQNATQPFGTIDTPAQGQTVSGVLGNFGWVLTPLPGFMPTDGSTIRLFIDGIPRGTALYNLPRADVAGLFPGYANTAGPVGYFAIDTTTLPNGLHTIAWSATDNLGRADGIGSRYFWVLN